MKGLLHLAEDYLPRSQWYRILDQQPIHVAITGTALQGVAALSFTIAILVYPTPKTQALLSIAPQILYVLGLVLVVIAHALSNASLPMAMISFGCSTGGALGLTSLLSKKEDWTFLAAWMWGGCLAVLGRIYEDKGLREPRESTDGYTA